MITLNQIHKIEDERNRIKKETYKMLYEKAAKKIKTAVESKQSSATVTTPSILIGQPLYNVTKATNYIIRQFKLGGFVISNYDNVDTFTISWPSVKRHVKTDNEDLGLSSLVNLRKIATNIRNK